MTVHRHVRLFLGALRPVLELTGRDASRDDTLAAHYDGGQAESRLTVALAPPAKQLFGGGKHA